MSNVYFIQIICAHYLPLNFQTHLEYDMHTHRWAQVACRVCMLNMYFIAIIIHEHRYGIIIWCISFCFLFLFYDGKSRTYGKIFVVILKSREPKLHHFEYQCCSTNVGKSVRHILCVYQHGHGSIF